MVLMNKMTMMINDDNKTKIKYHKVDCVYLKTNRYRIFVQ